jgi:hypothetical protein
MVVTVHGPVPSNYLIDVLCERFRTIELHRELCTTKDGENPVALLAKQKGSRGSGRSEPGHGGGESSGNNCSTSKGMRPSITCYGCGKKGYIKQDLSLYEEAGKRRTDPTAMTSGTNAHASSSHGGDAPYQQDEPGKVSWRYSLVPDGTRGDHVFHEYRWQSAILY